MAMKRKAETQPRGRPKGMPRTAAEIAADARRTGRPAVANDVAVSKGVTMRLTPEEHKQFSREAKRLNLSLSVYLRRCWRTAREGRNDGKNISQSGQADKSRDRKTGKRG